MTLFCGVWCLRRLLNLCLRICIQNESPCLSHVQVIVAFPADFSFSEEKQTSLLARAFSAGTKERHAQVETHTHNRKDSRILIAFIHARSNHKDPRDLESLLSFSLKQNHPSRPLRLDIPSAVALCRRLLVTESSYSVVSESTKHLSPLSPFSSLFHTSC